MTGRGELGEGVHRGRHPPRWPGLHLREVGVGRGPLVTALQNLGDPHREGGTLHSHRRCPWEYMGSHPPKCHINLCSFYLFIWLRSFPCNQPQGKFWEWGGLHALCGKRIWGPEEFASG